MCDGYENWRLRNNQHDVKHDKKKFEDYSCEKCYPVQFIHSNNKHFRRFTRWIRREIPETKSVSGKTAEKFLELLEIGRDFNRDNWNQKTKWRIEKNVNELLETIRYTKRPKITIKEIKEKLIYALETTQRFGTVQGKGLSESYVSGSEEEIFSEDEIVETVTKEKHWHDLQSERIIQHLKRVHEQEEMINEDNQDSSCGICYLVEEGIGSNEDYMTFWNWYKDYLPAISFSGVTVDIFRKLKKENRPARIIEKVSDIMISIRYYRKPRQSNTKILRKLGRLFSIWIYEEVTFLEAIDKEKGTLREAELSEISEISGKNTEENSPKKNDSATEMENLERERETFIEELEEELRNEMDTEKGKSKEKSVEEIIREIEYGIGREMSITEVNELQITLMNTDRLIGTIIEEFVEILRDHDKQKIQKDEELIEEFEEESDGTESSEESSEQEFENTEYLEGNDFEERDENVINTPQNLSDSTSENSDTSEEIEIEEMALNIIKCRQFDGELNNDVNIWIEEFDRVANANNWTEADQNNNQRTLMAKAHLTGEAAAWLQTGNNNDTFNRWKANGNAANQLAAGLQTRFNTPERQQRWQREFYQIKQQPGESVETYAIRFNTAARRVGNNVAEIGKATTFIQGLLPAIHPFAILGGQNTTMDTAVESAKRAELAAIGQLQQIMIPQNTNQSTLQNVGENVYRKLQKEKADENSIEELTKQFKDFKIQMLRNTNGNRRQDTRDIICWKCNEKGHYASSCENRYRITCTNCGKTGHTERNCRSKEKEVRFEGNERNGRRNRDLNYLGVTCEEEETPESEDSSDSEYSEDEREIFELGKRKLEGYVENDYERDEKKFKEKLTPDQRKKRQAEALRKGQDTRRAKNICNFCGVKGHFGTECERQWCSRCQQTGHIWNKCPKYPKEKKMRKEMDIDETTEERFRIAEHIVKELPKMIKKKALYESIHRYKEKGVKYLQKSGKPKFIPITCEVNIQGIETKAIIDSGAAATVMSSGLLKEIPYEITESSRVNFSPFGKGKYTSIGVIKEMEFFIGNVKTVIDVEVVDLPDKIFILGIDWMKKERAKIDLEKEILSIQKGNGNFEIPLNYIDEGTDDEDEENEEDEEYMY